ASCVAVPARAAAVTCVRGTARRWNVNGWIWGPAFARAAVKTWWTWYVSWSPVRYLIASVAACTSLPHAGSNNAAARQYRSWSGMLCSMPLRVCSWNVQLGRRLEVVLAALEELGRPD